MPPIVIANDPFNERYKVIEKIGEGSYSEVLKCKKRDSGDVFACKRLKHNYRGWNEVNEIAEIKSLRQLARHPNILQMTEVHFDPSIGRVCLVFEIMDRNLYELIKDRKRLLAEGRVRVMMFQLVRALRHLHKHGIFHRDVKPENILLKVANDTLKLGDLGSVRGLYSKPPYTEYISTRWYRSPECLLTAGHYGFKMDIWAAGCVFYEILTLRPLFPGSSELDQINRIHNILGPPPPRILQKFCNHAEVEREYSQTSSKKSRFESIKKVLNNLSSSKSRNFDWYFAPNKDPSGVDRLLPSHISVDARDLLRNLLQYDPDNRPSSHRVLQHQYFNELREKAAVQAKELVIDDDVRPLVTIVGDAHATALAMADVGHVDLGKLGDHKMKMKMRRLEESKKGKVEAPPAIIKQTETLSTGLDTNSLTQKREEHKSSIPKKINVVEEVLKAKKQIIIPPQLLFTKEENKIMSERMNSLKYKYPPIEKLHVDSKGRDADVDTPGSSTTNPTSNPKTLIPDPKLKKTLDRQVSRRHLNLEPKSSIQNISQSNYKTKEIEFSRAFIDKNKVNSARLRRINENRAMVQLEPIGGTDIKRSVLASDISPTSYLTRSLANTSKETAMVKPIQAQIMPQRSQRVTIQLPTNPELVIPKPKKLEKNLVPIKYPNQSVSDTRPILGNTEFPRRRSNIGNIQTRITPADLNPYYGNGRGLQNNSVPIKSDTPTLPKLSGTQKLNRSWVDHGVRADANTIRNELMVGKVPTIKKKEFRGAQTNHYDMVNTTTSIYESPYYSSKINANTDENAVQNQQTRPNNSEDPSIVKARRRRRNDLTYAKQTMLPSSSFTVQNLGQESTSRNVNVAALLEQQQQQRRLLSERRIAAPQQNSNRSSLVGSQYPTMIKKDEGEHPVHQPPTYFSKEAKLVQLANSFQRQRVNAPTGDQPPSYATTLTERDKVRQLVPLTLNRKSIPPTIDPKIISSVTQRKSLPADDNSTRPPVAPRRLKPTAQRGLAENTTPAELLSQAEIYRREGVSIGQNTNTIATNLANRITENRRPSQNIDLQIQRNMANAKLRAARNDDVFFSSDDDAVKRMREKVGSIITERASQRATLLQAIDNPKNQDSDEDLQSLRMRLPPGKRIRRELRPREPVAAVPTAGSWNTGQLLRDSGSYQVEPPSLYSTYQNERETQANTFYNAGSIRQDAVPLQLRSRIPLAQGQQKGQMYSPPTNKPTFLSSSRPTVGFVDMNLSHGQQNNSIVGPSNLNRSLYKDKPVRRRGPE